MKTPPWTYSQLDEFETCPRQFYRLRVLRDIPYVPNEAAMWGTRVHKALEQRVRDGKPLPDELRSLEGIASKLVALPGEKHCEVKLAIDKAFQPVKYKDPSAWSRGMGDLVVVHGRQAAAFDHKTGKRKPSDQLILYALYLFAHYPQVDEVQTAFIWIKEKRIDKQTVTRSDIPDLWQRFLPRVRRLEVAREKNEWPARPSGLCRGWCPVKDCEFYKDK